MALLVIDLVFAPKGKLPADLGLERQMIDPTPSGCDVEGAPRSGREAGPVQEDAGVVDEAGHRLTMFVHVDDVLLRAVVLPLLGREGGRGLLDPTGVLLVDEVGAVAATALNQFGRRAGENTLAAVPEDAGPVTREERDVEHPRPLLLVVLEAEPLVCVCRGRRHSQDDTWLPLRTQSRTRARVRAPVPRFADPAMQPPTALEPGRTPSSRIGGDQVAPSPTEVWSMDTGGAVDWRPWQ